MDILIKSIISGIVTAVILIIAKFSSPKLAGAIGGIPIVFAVSYVLLTLSNKSSLTLNYKTPQPHFSTGA